MAPEQLLPPWPNELLKPELKDRAISLLRGLRLPSRIASLQLKRWGDYTGVEIAREDYVRIRRDMTILPKE